MATRVPSVNNPFKLPDELKGFPRLYRALIRPIREADQKEGRLFVKRLFGGPQAVHDEVADAIAAAWDNHGVTTCPDDLLIFLKDIVGFDSELDFITDRLSSVDLRRLIRLAIPLWKQRYSELGIINLIRLLTGRNAVILNWFYFRSILDEVFLSEEQLGFDFWIIGGLVSFFDEFHSQIRVMDDGSLDRQLLLDLIDLERVTSERIEVAIVDFLDQFDLGRGKWENKAGTPAAIDTAAKTFVIPAGTDEQTVMADIFDNYVAVHKFNLGPGAVLLTQFYVKAFASIFYQVEVSEDFIELSRFDAGQTVISTPTLAFPIIEGLFYKLRVVTLDEGGAGALRIKVFIDGNLVINVLDSNPSGITKGDVIVGSEAGGDDVTIDNMEVYRLPLRNAQIDLDGTSTSANFFT